MEKEVAKENLELIQETMDETKFNLGRVGWFVLFYGVLEFVLAIVTNLIVRYTDLAHITNVLMIVNLLKEWCVWIVYFTFLAICSKRKDSETLKLLLVWGVVLVLIPLLSKSVKEIVQFFLPTARTTKIFDYLFFFNNTVWGNYHAEIIEKLILMGGLVYAVSYTGRLLQRTRYTVLAIVLASILLVIVVFYVLSIFELIDMMNLLYYLANIARVSIATFYVAFGIFLITQRWNKRTAK